MICQKCGKKVGKKELFCPSCGYYLGDEDAKKLGEKDEFSEELSKTCLLVYSFLLFLK